ncbi:MAG: SNF2-related protein, partial [Phycisphaeraceae bacterium]
MRVLRHSGTDRLIDVLRSHLAGCQHLDLATSTISLFAFEELLPDFRRLDEARLIVAEDHHAAALQGDEADRALRNQLLVPWLAAEFESWLRRKVDVCVSSLGVPQGAAVLRRQSGTAEHALLGAFSLTTGGLGLAPGNPLSIIQCSESTDEASAIAEWFDAQWQSFSGQNNGKQHLLDRLAVLMHERSAISIYSLMLHHVLGSRGDALDEDQIVNAATGIRNTVVWKKLYKFQRDAAVGAIDKLNRFGGCVIADSVGLGKTFEALAIIKYHELRNDRVLVLCPKRLRDNWTLYAANDRRNILAADRFNYDVINHTDLSRDGGISGDIDLGHVNWGNYDLVVIDESHNFRNKKSPRQGGETRYDRLMKRIIKQGVRTRVLMLSATPVNNRLADLRNQIAFATEGD